MKKIIKNYDYLIITFIISMLAMITIYILKSVTPFGSGSLLTIDFYHQYGPMLGELYDRITGHLSLIYSFRMGLGLPIYRNFFNYLSSPLNLIMIFFKHKDLIASFSIIIAIRTSLSAITMCYYLNKKFNKNYLFIGLSILYAFSAYFAAYYWNVMWLDGMVMLPLVIYGIEELIDKNKCLIYIVSLAIMILSSYYIAYMICIFSVLYFITYLIIQSDVITTKQIPNKVLYFAISSIIAGGLCAFFILPLYQAISGISATGDIVPTRQYYDFTPQELIFGHLSGVKTTVLKSDIANAPNVSTSILSIALLVLFICNRKIDNKIKVGYIFLLAFLIVSYIVAPIDFVWQGFHTPNDLPYRYSFIYSFLMILIGAYSIDKIKYVKKINVFGIYILLLIFVGLSKIFEYKCLSKTMYIMNYSLITIYILLYVLWKLCENKKRIVTITKTIFILAIAAESVLAIDDAWLIDTEKKELYRDYEKIQETKNYLKEHDNDIYRIEKDSVNSFSDPSWYGYNGQVGFSSMEYETLAMEQYDIGMPGNYINSFYYKENTPIYNMMFNLKYILGSVNLKDNYTLFHKQKGMNIYQSKYSIGLMYGVDNDIKELKTRKRAPLENQELFIEQSTNITDVLERIDITSEIEHTDSKGTIVKYKYENAKDNIYLYFSNEDIEFILINEKLYHPDSNYNAGYFKDKYYEDESYGEKYVIGVKPSKSNEFYIKYNNYNKSYDEDISIYRINYNKLSEAYNKLLDNKAKITDFKENYIKAESNFKKDLTMYTSIPYDAGWKVYIDGKQVKTITLVSAFLGFEVPQGKHKIVLKYEIPHIKEGLCISTISMVGLIILARKTNPKQKKKKVKQTKQKIRLQKQQI